MATKQRRETHSLFCFAFSFWSSCRDTKKPKSPLSGKLGRIPLRFLLSCQTQCWDGWNKQSSSYKERGMSNRCSFWTRQRRSQNSRRAQKVHQKGLKEALAKGSGPGASEGMLRRNTVAQLTWLGVFVPWMGLNALVMCLPGENNCYLCCSRKVDQQISWCPFNPIFLLLLWKGPLCE